MIISKSDERFLFFFSIKGWGGDPIHDIPNNNGDTVSTLLVPKGISQS
jgi:hypothetical protein